VAPDLAGAGLNRNRILAAFLVAVAVSVTLGLVPVGQKIIYPFALFATWAHEMGHGVGALITGNSFRELELYSSLGGQALIAGASGWSQVAVSALGLIGPAVLGAAVMVAGSRVATAPYVLSALAGLVALSTLIWIRNGFGFAAMLTIAAALAAAARFASPMVRVVLAQLLAIQLALAAWSSRDYLFISGFERNGFQKSDTQRIADELWLPYWFWGGLLGLLSVAILSWAFWIAWLRPFADSVEP
jgi:hypothetical protein